MYLFIWATEKNILVNSIMIIVIHIDDNIVMINYKSS